MSSPFALGVGLWVTQSLLAAALVVGWFAAVRRAKRDGMGAPARWLFPWARAWRAGAKVVVAIETVCAVLYALTWWLARHA